MASCTNCGRDFQGEPWHYVEAGRAHMNCDPIVRPRPQARPRPQLTSPEFSAKYPGRCSLCEKGYRVGTRITRIGPKKVAHVSCATSGALLCGHEWPTPAELDAVALGLARKRTCAVCRRSVWPER